jgi:hypothetical protein
VSLMKILIIFLIIKLEPKLEPAPWARTPRAQPSTNRTGSWTSLDYKDFFFLASNTAQVEISPELFCSRIMDYKLYIGLWAFFLSLQVLMELMELMDIELLNSIVFLGGNSDILFSSYITNQSLDACHRHHFQPQKQKKEIEIYEARDKRTRTVRRYNSASQLPPLTTLHIIHETRIYNQQLTSLSDDYHLN